MPLRTLTSAFLAMDDPRACTICRCVFDIEEEGGVDASVGAISFSLCPMCLDIVEGVVLSMQQGDLFDDEDYDEDD